jgi:hypothetical protein
VGVAFPADYLEESKFHGNLLTPFELGAFVSWKMYPDVHVSLDARFEVAYPHQVVADHVTLLARLRDALVPGGRIAVAAWAQPDVPERAAARRRS